MILVDIFCNISFRCFVMTSAFSLRMKKNAKSDNTMIKHDNTMMKRDSTMLGRQYVGNIDNTMVKREAQQYDVKGPFHCRASPSCCRTVTIILLPSYCRTSPSNCHLHNIDLRHRTVELHRLIVDLQNRTVDLHHLTV